MSTDAPKLTYQDYVCFPDDGNRYEIIGGARHVNPAPNIYHQQVSSRLQFQLYSCVELPNLGVVLTATVDVQLTDHDVVQPDLVVVLAENRIITPTKIKGSPDHVVEILSPSTQDVDRSRKRDLYEQAGVPEYWIVDPLEHSVLRLVMKEGRYAGSTHSTEVHLGYVDSVIDLKRIW